MEIPIITLPGGDLSVDELIQEMLQAVRRVLGMQVAFVSEFNEGRRVFRYVDSDRSFSPVQVGQWDPLNASYCQLVVDGKLPELIYDARREPTVQHLAATHELPVGAHLSVPIRFSGGEVYGTFCCFSQHPDETLNQRDLSALRLFAGFAARVLERRSAQEQFRRCARERVQKVLAEQQFSILYQPIINVALNRLVGHEALALFHPQPKRSPDKWFFEAHQAGLGEELELMLVARALEGLAAFPADSYISINLSPETIIGGRLEEVLKRHDLNRIVLEVTEHTSVSDYADIARHLAGLRRRGLKLAVDDAGAGFASFRHILKLNPDIIKLDASLIQKIDLDKPSRALAAALIRFAEEIGSKVVAEGVETESELAVLRELKVSKAQGYLLGRPAALDECLDTTRWGP
ncbi:sensor domain-containing phosphodiesterase [Pseudomonas sp.]|uniref:sensor domain-containing phosphodiesterase n=1 Tax=Pseudomonas sp. TaxID=306 RepID=UPI00272CD02D|nr:EAL domain-containing protein [Pseudomonas sp.]